MPNGTHGHLATRAHHGEPQPSPVAAAAAADVPSKRDLASWWKNFKRSTAKREEEKVEPQPPQGIFGVPLQQSIRYANVAISLYNNDGESYIYGYVPIVVAKCGVFLKEKATDIEGIFRLSGSEKRIKELRTAFDSPDRYGKGLDWTGYTVHDAANILRRYFNQLPEPIIPLEFYDRFRAPIRGHQSQAVGPMDGQAEVVGDFDVNAAIKTYQTLITELPPLNRQLLLYILDLLAVFASKADLNKMTTANLAAIFQPGILSHPAHDMAPAEYRLSQDVLIFLIDNQDHFLIGMQGTAADQKTVDEVQSGQTTPQAKTPSSVRSKGALGRSGSTSSAGAESLRKFGGIRRNVSVSSRRSKASVTNSPVTPSFVASSSGLHRSNTLPSKKSPAINPATTFAIDKSSEPTEDAEPEEITTAIGSAQLSSAQQELQEFSSQQVPPQIVAAPPSGNSTPVALQPNANSEAVFAGNVTTESRRAPPPGPLPAPTTPGKEKLGLPYPTPPAADLPTPGSEMSASGARSFSSLFSRPSPMDGEKRELRRPNKLQKKRIPSTNPSAHSSTGSLAAALSGGEGPPSPIRPTFVSPIPQDAVYPPNTVESTPPRAQGSSLKPNMSPSPSYRSHSTAAELSEVEQGEETPTAEAPEMQKRRRWRVSRHRPERADDSDREKEVMPLPHPGSTNAGFIPEADRSMSSFSNASRGRKSFTSESPYHQSNQSGVVASTNNGSEASMSGLVPRQAQTDSSQHSFGSKESEKKGPINWFREKIQEHKNKEAEKQRAKSPPNSRSNNNGMHVAGSSVGSLGLVVERESLPIRGKSMDIPRAERVEAERKRRESSDDATPTGTPGQM